jgi:hypothetical protein
MALEWELVTDDRSEVIFPKDDPSGAKKLEPRQRAVGGDDREYLLATPAADSWWLVLMIDGKLIEQGDFPSEDAAKEQADDWADGYQ